MNQWKDIFGTAPSSFTQKVQSTLAELEDQPANETKTTGAKRRIGRSGRIGILIAVIAALLCGTALAVGAHSRFYNSLLGNTALEGDTTTEARDMTYFDNEKQTVVEYRLPGYELVQVDEEAAEALLGDYMQIGGSIVIGDYTVTLDSFVQDENGVTLACCSVEAPNVLDGVEFSDYNGWTQVSKYPDGFPGIFTSGGFEYVDTDLTTDTKLCLCLACVDMTTSHLEDLETGLYSDLSGLSEQERAAVTDEIRDGWQTSLGCWLRVYEPCASGTYVEDMTLAGEFSLASDTLLPVITAESGGVTVRLSPIGVCVRGEYGEVMVASAEIRRGFEVDSLIITMRDGSEYVVMDDDIENTHYVLGGGDIAPDETFCFNRLIDPSEVDFITVSGAITADCGNEGVTVRVDF